MLFERNNVIIAVSEGIRDASGNYISASEKSVDTFGHSQLSGAGKTLEFLVKEKLGVKVRSIEVNVLQRAVKFYHDDKEDEDCRSSHNPFVRF